MAASELTAQAAVKPAHLPHHHVLAVTLGNALEFYDFLTYSFFAAQIGRTFFPSDNPISSLLASLATFGAGFLTRPVGALIIGRLGDKVGRKPAMFLSFGLMGLAMLGLALTPSYAAIGIVAPSLAIAFRLIQGFALGGEVGPSTAYLMEAAPAHRRGAYVSLQGASQQLAVLAAGLLGYGLAHALSDQALDAWGWRVAFLVGAVIVPFGLVLRASLAETFEPAAPDDAETKPRLAYGRVAVVALMLLTSGTIATYVMNNLTTWSNTTLGMSTSASFGATVSQGLTGMIFSFVGGALSDRLGRRAMMLWPRVLLLLAVNPCFWMIGHFRTAEALFIATAVMGVLFGLSMGATFASITESLPRPVRAGALAIIYAVAISVFGGSTQFVVTRLTALTGEPLTPAFYMMAALVVGVAGSVLMPESAPIKVGDRELSAPG